MNMVKLRLSLRELLYNKVLIKKQLEEKLSEESIKKSINDYHAKKRPRPCGFTIHSVIGCVYGCLYCYIPELGYDISKARVYGLTGEEMVYSLLSNPYFLPGRHGSYLAIGSVGEPFLPIGVKKTLEYINAFNKYLGNPIQFSTKSFINDQLAKKLALFKNISISSLVTIISLTEYKVLELYSPPPELRLLTIKNLRKSGLHPIVFLRPIMPGINSDEIISIINEAKKYGAEGIVLGGFRISRKILERLEKAGLKIDEIKKRIKTKMKREGLVDIYIKDIKEKAAKDARKRGLIPFYSACCANTYTFFKKFGYRIPCAGLDFIDNVFCTRCPVLCENIEVEIDPEEVKYYIKKFFGDIKDIEVRGYYITIYVKNKKRFLNRLRSKSGYRLLIETAYRKKIVVSDG